MHFLVLGAAGAIGTIFLEIATQEGHNVTALVRNTSKFEQSFQHHNQVKVIEGSLDSEDSVEECLSAEPDVFISFAGPVMGRGQGTPLTDGYTTLLPKLQSRGIKRVLILGTPSCSSKSDIPSTFWNFSRWFMRTFYPYPYMEMVGIGNLISSQPERSCQWTLFRVGGLTDAAESKVTETYLGSGEDRISISRRSVARWVLTEALDGCWIEQAPYICN